jgi:hypothetical protein
MGETHETGELRTMAEANGLQTLASGMTLRAQAPTDPQDPEDAGSFAGKAYGGGPFAQWWGTAVLDLNGYAPHGRAIPSLYNHRTYAASPEETQVGYIPIGGMEVRTFEDAGVKGMGVFVSGRYLPTSIGQSCRKTALAGAPWELSLWTDIHELDELRPGDSEIVNGVEIHGPAVIARAWTPRELSHVEVGADLDAPLQSAAERAQEAQTMTATAPKKPRSRRRSSKATPAALAAKAGAAESTEPTATPSETTAKSVDLDGVSAADLRAAIEESGDDELKALLAQEDEEEAEETTATEEEETAATDDGVEPEETTAAAVARTKLATIAGAGDAASPEDLATLASAAGAPDGTLSSWIASKATLASAAVELAIASADRAEAAEEKLAALAGHTGAPAVETRSAGDGDGTQAAARPGEVFPGVAADAEDPAATWKASSALREWWTEREGNETRARRAFLAFASMAKSPTSGIDWRKMPTA